MVILWPLNLARKNCNHLKKGPQLPFAAAMMIRRQKAKFSKSQVRSLRVIWESFEKEQCSVRLSERLDEAFDDHPSRDYFECSIRTIEQSSFWQKRSLWQREGTLWWGKVMGHAWTQTYLKTQYWVFVTQGHRSILLSNFVLTTHYFLLNYCKTRKLISNLKK